ncbi:MAG: DegT/DnrJ/EryC1/StrS aminotransferase [Proteobacteria bacterium]|nr:DegT/DnrJ/EryC1/StrS aminotransferase [Pseudomonadota bacterium]
MNEREKAIHNLVQKYAQRDPLKQDIKGLPLAAISFGCEEIEEAIESLISGWITMGKKVRLFEDAWAEYIGVKEAIAVNSGSSALLVMLTAMVECGYLSPEQEVILPAVGWSTSLFSVVQAGLTPVLVDVDLDTISLKGDFDRPVLALHLLGAAAQVNAPIVMEDACGAHGGMIGAKKLGSFGHCGAFSFFFSHHITTGEGGMITTSDSRLADACRSIRAHGWIRERTDQQKWIDAHPQIDPRFLFATSGYNVRMTDVAAAMGIHQVNRIENFVKIRRENHSAWCEWITSEDLPLRVFPETPNTRHAAFAFPILLNEDSPLSRSQLCALLEADGIQTRPISGSHLAKQPAFAKLQRGYQEGITPNADAIHQRGFFVGQSHAFGEKQGTFLVERLKFHLQ